VIGFILGRVFRSDTFTRGNSEHEPTSPPRSGITHTSTPIAEEAPFPTLPAFSAGTTLTGQRQPLSSLTRTATDNHSPTRLDPYDYTRSAASADLIEREITEILSSPDIAVALDTVSAEALARLHQDLDSYRNRRPDIKGIVRAIKLEIARSKSSSGDYITVPMDGGGKFDFKPPIGQSGSAKSVSWIQTVDGELRCFVATENDYPILFDAQRMAAHPLLYLKVRVLENLNLPK
jgi:hypothetical protein